MSTLPIRESVREIQKTPVQLQLLEREQLLATRPEEACIECHLDGLPGLSTAQLLEEEEEAAARAEFAGAVIVALIWIAIFTVIALAASGVIGWLWTIIPGVFVVGTTVYTMIHTAGRLYKAIR